MKKIPLTQGKFAIVDDEDYEWLSKYKWQAINQRGYWYARRRNKEGKSIYMHREILNVPKEKETDHINHNSLDNTRCNIRICTKQQNYHNQRKGRRKTSSKYKGVNWWKTGRKWQARIGHNNQRISLGFFNSEIEAAKTYDKAARELFGEFARPNFKK